MGFKQCPLESMELVPPKKISPSFWKGKRVFITGHTGFKGSWLSLWLQTLGADIKGYSLAPPTTPSLFTVASVSKNMLSEIGDIRDRENLTHSMKAFEPEIVIHMAAQPLVRLSYSEPVITYETNVMGTVNVLEAIRSTATVRSAVSVTTDKCYENREWEWGYRENEPMGGHDPYSNSKGCAELVTSAYRKSYFESSNVNLASARAGNVIGGGDWAADRLIPDILRAFEQRTTVRIRNPHSIRPWQHVLEPLSGYLTLAQSLYSKQGHRFAEGWNFGPREEDAQPVGWIVEEIAKSWHGDANWKIDEGPHPHEANFLKLDISKAKVRLGWQPSWTLSRALDSIVQWHRSWLEQSDMRTICLQQIEQFNQS